jgi:hypothetical protein
MPGVDFIKELPKHESIWPPLAIERQFSTLPLEAKVTPGSHVRVYAACT